LPVIQATFTLGKAGLREFVFWGKFPTKLHLIASVCILPAQARDHNGADVIRARNAEVALLSRRIERIRRNEILHPGQQTLKLFEKHKGTRLTSQTSERLQRSFSKLGPFDHLVVFTAGDGLHLHNLASTDLQQARRAFELRYWAALAAVKYGSPHIRKEVPSCLQPESPASARKKDG
jgi:hypothetical protein